MQNANDLPQFSWTGFLIMVFLLTYLGGKYREWLHKCNDEAEGKRLARIQFEKEKEYERLKKEQ